MAKTASMGTLAVYLTAKADGLERGLNKGVKALKGFASMALAAFGVNSLKNFAEESLNLFGIQEQNEQRLAGVLKATNYAAGLGAKELKNYASELQGMTTYGDESILKLQTTLLAFTGVAGEEFKRATALALDMTEVLGTGATENIKKLGKSLDDPKSALTGLMEVGIFFTEEQKKQITQLVDAGKKREAQLVILAELERHYGGAASAAADTVLGRQIQMQNAWGDLREEIGRLLAMMFSVKDVSGDLTTTFSNWANTLKSEGAEIAFSFKAIWIDFSSGLKLLWALVEPVILGIGDILHVSINNWGNILYWLYDSIVKWFSNLGKVRDSFVNDFISSIAEIPKIIASMWQKVIKAVASGDISSVSSIVVSELFKAGKGKLQETVRNAMKAAGISTIPKMQDINSEELFGRFGKIGSEWDRIERERVHQQNQLGKWLDGIKNQSEEKPGTGTGNGTGGTQSAGIIGQNAAKMTTTALFGSLEAYQARYNTGKDFENKLIKLQQDQLTESKNQTNAIKKLGNNGITLGVADM